MCGTGYPDQECEDSGVNNVSAMEEGLEGGRVCMGSADGDVPVGEDRFRREHNTTDPCFESARHARATSAH